MLPVVLLSGGLATRMRDYTEKIPKAMIDIEGKPFIHWQLTLLRQQGVERVMLCVGYLGELIEAYVGDGNRYGLRLTYFYDGDRLMGTGGAIKKIEDFLPEAFFVLYGDSYLETPYKPVEDAFFKSDKQGLMTVYENRNLYDTSNVIFRDGRLVAYNKKDKSPDMRHIDYGLCILRKEVFSDFPAGEVFDLADVYEKLAKEEQLSGYEVFERFYEIGSYSGLEELTEKISVSPGARASRPQIPESAGILPAFPAKPECLAITAMVEGGNE